MKDNTPVKIICRIINLIIYTCTITGLAIIIITDSYNSIEIIDNYFSDYVKAILICTIPIIIIMIISLVIKYTMENKSKVNIYRILDTITRITATIPISITISYYIIKYIKLDSIVNAIITILVFIIIDKLIKFTLQETLSVTFITNDNL